MGVELYLDFAHLISRTLDFIAALIRSPIYASHGLALRAIQCEVVFSSWFVKEAMMLMMTSTLLPLVARQKHDSTF